MIGKYKFASSKFSVNYEFQCSKSAFHLVAIMGITRRIHSIPSSHYIGQLHNSKCKQFNSIMPRRLNHSSNNSGNNEKVTSDSKKKFSTLITKQVFISNNRPDWAVEYEKVTDAQILYTLPNENYSFSFSFFYNVYLHIKSLKLFLLLKQPILSKYKFDILEFVEGAKQAFTVINFAFDRGIGGVDYNLTAGDKFYQKLTKESALHILADGLDNELFESFKKVADNFNDFLNKVDSNLFENMLSVKPRVYLADLSISKCALKKVNVRIISNDEEGNVSNYAPGSVVVNLDVEFTSTESYARIGGDVADTRAILNIKEAVNSWQFEGCISGQSVLSWKVVKMYKQRSKNV